jgi:hypothetical protein
MTMAPDIGDLFELPGDLPGSPPRAYRVDCWLKKAPPPAPVPAWLADVVDTASGMHGPDKCRLMFCTREEAEYVSGSGICGTIQRVSDITVTGRVRWSEESIEDQRSFANTLAGERLF